MMRLAKQISLCSKVVYHKCQHQTNASNTLWKAGNINAADQYWLSYSLANYTLKELGAPKTYILYAQLLREYSSLLYFRTEELPDKIRQAIFTLAGSFLRCLYSPNYRLEGVKASYNKALLGKNFSKWNWINQKEWLKSKLKLK